MDEPVLVGEVVGGDRAVWVSTCCMAIIFDAESLGNKDCEMEKLLLS